MSQYSGLNFPLASFTLTTATPRLPIDEKARCASFYMILGRLSTNERASNTDCRHSANERLLNIGDVIFADIAAAMIFGDDYL